ncbi:MAG: type II secretion system protein GspE [Polaromonas sp.]|nr:type II secretion system protein GspE [Polaromonas sp.]
MHLTKRLHSLTLLGFCMSASNFSKIPASITDLKPIQGLEPGFMRANQVLIALSPSGDTLALLGTRANFAAVDAAEQKLGLSVVLVPCPDADLSEAILAVYGNVDESFAVKASDEGESGMDVDDDLSVLKQLAEDAPVVKFVQTQLGRALSSGASDLHFEVSKESFRVRARIDGLLVEQERAARSMYMPTISHLKIRAHMNIAERRLPQDGRAKFELHGRMVDLRVSTIPTVYGESMVIRLLEQGPGTLDIDHLGLDARGLSLINGAIAQPHGMVLVTGPTGSGKTTTLYAALKRLNVSSRKIITVEDPVEYQIEGVNQIQVKSAIGLNFPSALRSIVRQDPDVILIGEIRDTETAHIAIQSALTGHLVLSTLHTNDSFSAFHRLMDMDVEGYLIASSVVMVVAQRLVRLICTHCKEQVLPATSDVVLLKQLSPSVSRVDHLWHGKGCAECGHSGFRGRAGVYEFLPVTNAIKEVILARGSAEAIRRVALAEGVTTMTAHGIDMVLSGKTTLEELLRVTRQDLS